MAENIEATFRFFEEIWAAFPGYFKVFLYATVSAFVGLYLAGKQIDFRTVVFIVATNLGLYKGPRMVADQTRKRLK